METLKTYFRSNITDKDHDLYKVFIKHLLDEGTSIVQRSMDSYILLNEKKHKSITIGNKMMEIVDRNNILMIIPHDYMAEKMVERTRKEIDRKISTVYSRVEMYRKETIKKLL